jgi:hypothetical protein
MRSCFFNNQIFKTMKNKSIILDATIILVSVAIVAVCFGYVYFTSITDGVIPGLLGVFLGFQMSHLFRYWGMKESDFAATHIDKNRAMKTWQYITLTFSIMALIMQLLYINYTIENLKFFSAYFLIWMIVTGNFRATIDPILETLSIYIDDPDIKRKTLRFSGKCTFFCGIGGLIMVLILPQKLGVYFCGGLIFVSSIIPEFYAKMIFKRKYA